MGDMPIYVPADSADVWAHQDLFDFDHVSGAPPGDFREEGQMWGQPIYRVKEKRREVMEWFAHRVDNLFDYYDILRFDHARWISEFWSIPKGAKTAWEGDWVEGIGEEFLFKMQEAAYRRGKVLIAENLGVSFNGKGFLDTGINRMIRQTGTLGMLVEQFEAVKSKSERDADMIEPAMLYTGTHDNNTLAGWWRELDISQRERVVENFTSLRERNSPFIFYPWPETRTLRGIIGEEFSSPHPFVILPIQDVIGLGGLHKMNVPGVAMKWDWKLPKEIYDALLNNGYALIAARDLEMGEFSGKVPFDMSMPKAWLKG